MRDGDFVGSLAGDLSDKPDAIALAQKPLAAIERAEPDLWSLQVDENSDRPSAFQFQRAHRAMERGELGVRGVTHVDAENVDAGIEQSGNALLRRRRWP